MMKKSFAVFAMLSLALSSCTKDVFVKNDKIRVMVEEGQGYAVAQPVQDIKPGEDAVFHINLEPGTQFVTASYGDFDVENEFDTSFDLRFRHIKYPLTITLEIAHGYFTYNANGGRAYNNRDFFREPARGAHLRENSANGFEKVSRSGYAPIGWNTSSDYTGTYVPFGSRIPFGVNTLYAQWEKETPYEYFRTQQNENGVAIAEYFGDFSTVVVPDTIGGKTVNAIARNAFMDKNISKLVLGRNVKTIEEDAFFDSKVEELYCCDSIIEVNGKSFRNSVKTIHMNAVLDPCFSGTYYDAFPDKIDYLDFVKDQKKMILFAGSSTRYGYYSPIFEEAYPEYKVVNMGVFAYVVIRPQLDVITAFMKEGDVLLSSPEFDPNSLDTQMGTSKTFTWNLFPFFEGNWDLLKYLNLHDYTDFFDGFYYFQQRKLTLAKKNYAITVMHFDDDGNYHPEDVYNIQGDMIFDRPGNPTDTWIMQPLVNYTKGVFTDARIDSLNSIYQWLKDKGITVYFTFSPKNRNAMTPESTLEARTEAQQLLRDRLIVPVITDWEDCILPGTDFYLIDNHLSSFAAKERTHRVVKDLRPYLGGE